MYDIIIIGAGPTGLTAAIYAARKKLNTLVLSKNVGGQTLWSSGIENYLGYHLISGVELVQKFEEHLKDFDVELKTNVEVNSVKQIPGGFEVSTKDEKYQGKAVIVASGKIPRKLNVPGEDEFLGKGVTYCATCDAPLFSGKDVSVIGGGNSALEAALQLSKIANKIYIIDIESKLGGDEVTRDKVKSAENIEILTNTQVLEINGETFVNNIKIKDKIKETEQVLDVSGVFIEIGSVPSVDFVKDLVKTNKLNEIKVNCKCKTNVPGLFAGGDVTDVPEKQIIVAAGEGCKAALTAYKYLARMK